MKKLFKEIFEEHREEIEAFNNYVNLRNER